MHITPWPVLRKEWWLLRTRVTEEGVEGEEDGNSSPTLQRKQHHVRSRKTTQV